MTAADLADLRRSLDLTQASMAERIGLSLRAYAEIEGGKAKLRTLHALAAERVALAIAVERGNPMLAPGSVRAQALDLAALVRS